MPGAIYCAAIDRGAGWPLGPRTLFAQARDNHDLLSEVKAKYPAFVIEDVQVEYQGLCPACQVATAK